MTRHLRGTEALALAPRPAVLVPLGNKGRRPLAEYVPGWLFWMQHALGRSPATIEGYRFDARMFIAFLEQIGSIYPDEVTYQIAEAFGASLRVNLRQRESSIMRKYSAMKRLFFYLQREKVVRENPFALALPMKQPPRKPPEFMTKEERDRILAHLRGVGTLAGQRHYTLTLCLFYSGLREAEIVGLRVEDCRLDESNAYLHVREGKGRKDRLVPIPPILRDGLRHYLAEVRPGLAPPADKRWLFIHCGQRNRESLEPLNTKTIWHFVMRTIIPLLGRRVTPHIFRHSYATHLYEGSSDLNLVKSLLGHTSIRTTAVYAHVTPRKQRERLAEYLK